MNIKTESDENPNLGSQEKEPNKVEKKKPIAVTKASKYNAKDDPGGLAESEQELLNFYHQNYIRKLVAASLDPLTKTTTENLSVVADIKDKMKSLKRDFEFEQAYTKSALSKLALKTELQSKVSMVEQRQHTENKELWSNIQKIELENTK